VVVVDAGGSFVKPGPAGDPQQLGKAEIVAAAMKLGGIDALTLSASDWSLGADAVFTLVRSKELPVLAANLVCDGARPFPASVVVERGGRRIGVVGLTDGVVPGCEVEDARAALERAVGELGEVDVTVALLPFEAHVSRKVLEPALGVNLALDLQSSRIGVDSEVLGGALMLGSGPRGQRVGLATLSWRDGATGWVVDAGADRTDAEVQRQERLITSLQDRLKTAEGSARARIEQQITRVQRDLDAARARLEDMAARQSSANVVSGRVVELDAALGDHAETAAVVKAWLDTTSARAPVSASPHVGAPGSAWVGSDACKACHPAETEQWLTTPHARAWQALVDDGHAGDNDCFGCHVTGAHKMGGPTTAAAVGGLIDVQCEACHGPGRQHLADPANIKPVRSPPESVCRDCHDGERDGGRFVPETYLPKVVHLTPGG
jgi:hypothetical protein